jgi:hypothetical protein
VTVAAEPAAPRRKLGRFFAAVPVEPEPPARNHFPGVPKAEPVQAESAPAAPRPRPRPAAADRPRPGAGR